MTELTYYTRVSLLSSCECLLVSPHCTLYCHPHLPLPPSPPHHHYHHHYCHEAPPHPCSDTLIVVTVIMVQVSLISWTVMETSGHSIGQYQLSSVFNRFAGWCWPVILAQVALSTERVISSEVRPEQSTLQSTAHHCDQHCYDQWEFRYKVVITEWMCCSNKLLDEMMMLYHTIVASSDLPSIVSCFALRYDFRYNLGQTKLLTTTAALLSCPVPLITATPQLQWCSSRDWEQRSKDLCAQ